MSPVRRIRNARGLSSSQLAVACGCCPSTVQQAEAGLLERPRKLLLSLAMLTGECFEDLVEQHTLFRASLQADFRSRLVTKA